MFEIFADARILILSILVFFTIIIAVILIIIDNMSHKKNEKKKENDLVDDKIVELDSLMKKVKIPRERLGILNDKAKELFEEVFGISRTRDYEFLKNYFEERKLDKYASFCKKIFDLFYCADQVSNVELDELYEDLVGLIELSKHVLGEKANEKTQNKIKKETPIENTQKEKEKIKTSVITKEKIRPVINKIPKIQPQIETITDDQKKIIESIKKRKIALDLQEQKNIELLKQTEISLKQQQKLQMELKSQLKEQQEKSKKIEQNLTMNKIDDSILHNDKTKTNSNKKWYGDIDAKPIQGKDLVNQLKKRRKPKTL